MKYLLFLCLLLGLILPSDLRAQIYLPDTIRISRSTTTYLIFPSPVTLVDISPEYLAKIESGNVVFIRPRLTGARKTPFFIRTEQGAYLGYLGTSAQAPTAFIEIGKRVPAPAADYTGSHRPEARKSVSPGTPAGTALPILPADTAPLDTAWQHLDPFLNGPVTHYQRRSNSGIVVRLTHLVHDSTHTYVQLRLRNRTAMPFLLDQIHFWYQHEARRRSGVYLDGETYPINPVLTQTPERVGAGQQVRCRFVLPQFAPQRRSRFVLNVREKTGTRNVTLRLPMRSVLYAGSRLTAAPRPNPKKVALRWPFLARFH